MSSSTEREPVPSQTSGGPGPDSPLDLQPRDWKSTGKRTLKEIKDDRVTLVAAGMAYYFFLAIFPALIALVGLLGLAHINPSGLINSIRTSLPGGAGTALTKAIAQADKPSKGASLIAVIGGIIVAVFSASSGMVAMQKGLNIAYDVPKDRKFLPARAIALVLLIAVALLGGVPSPFFSWGQSTIYTVLGYIISIVAVIILFSIFYYLAPNRESPSWRWVSAGGILGTVLWILVSIALGLYVANFNSYSKTYGPLAGVIVLILWLFLSSLAVLIGGELNAELERQAAATTGQTASANAR
ncbi:MAG: rane protein [Actinomycetota bacterium]|nr:rane protein [Actinomycetota bacterium]